MSNTITNLTTSNTFAQWLTSTQSLVNRMNSLSEGGSSSTFTANTNIDIANDVTIGGNLTVSGNLSLDSLGFDDLSVAGSGTFGTTLDVGGNTNLATYATINYTNQETANITLLVGSSNTAIYANIAAAQASSSGDGLAFAIALG